MSNILVHFLRRSGLCDLRRNSARLPLSSFLKNRHLCLTTSYQVKEEGSTKKAKDAIKITLLGPNHAISVVSLEDAKSLSKRRDLELVKVKDLDTKTQRPVYKLLTKAELLAQEAAELGPDDSKKSSKKSEKILTISDKIGENDLNPRLKNISKWLSKGHEIRVLIQCASADALNGEKIFSKIEATIQEGDAGKILQKRVKSNTIKFIIVPVVKKDS